MMRLVIATLSLLIGLGISGSAKAAVTAEQRAKVAELNKQMQSAGQLYTDGKLGECVAKVKLVQAGLEELLSESKDPRLQGMVKKLYTRLDNAHGLLEVQGAELEGLPSWAELTRGMKPDDAKGELVSFKEDVAPWLVSACGNCHIDNSRGQFSIASFAALSRGARGARVVYAGDPKGSRLVEVIESGDMPRGGAKVSSEQLDALKKWIAQGAKFDGPNPNTELRSFASAASEPAQRSMPAEPKTPTGSETVSFAKDIAPILLENCNGCHIAGRRASGNLRMDSFQQMMRGGDSGELVAGTNANNSLLIKKLRGQAGRQMPAGRDPLSDDQISLISTWIREGAAYDGPAPGTNIQTVVNQAWAADATHEELFSERKKRSLESWTKVLPNDEPASVASDEVLVLGNVQAARLEEILESAEAAARQTKKLLRADSEAPLVKGGITVFVLKSRYDYSEFGRMTENRELPKSWMGHWQADPLEVYAVLADDGEIEDKQQQALTLQVIAGAYLGGFSEVPTWFAEGVARNLVIAQYRRGDPRVAAWQSALPAAMQQVKNANSLLQDRLDEEASGLAGMALTSFMMNPANRRRFDKLLELLREGRTFKEATTFAFAPPETLVKAWLGKK